MLLILLTLFVFGPIAEIYVLLAAGGAFGVLPVIAACLVTAFTGGWLIKVQGVNALNSAQRDIAQGKVPVDLAVDGALLVIAAPLLMTPGFITDAAGFALLIPPLRRMIARHALRAVKKRIDRADATITIHRP